MALVPPASSTAPAAGGLNPGTNISTGGGGNLISTAGRMVTLGAPEFGFGPLVEWVNSTSNGTWYGANLPLAIPFRTTGDATVQALGIHNGTGVLTDSFDIGIYTTGLARLLSTGSTAFSAGSNAWQWVTVASTPLSAGAYYLVVGMNGVTAGQFIQLGGLGGNAIGMNFAGLLDTATAQFPLPANLSNMVGNTTCTVIPLMSIAFATPFA